MKQLLKTANTFRTNFLAFTAFFALIIGAGSLNSCTKSMQKDAEVAPTASTNPNARLGSSAISGSLGDCATLNLTAQTTLSGSATGTNPTTMLEELVFTEIIGADHYVVEATDVSGTVLYSQTAYVVAPHSFTRPLSFQGITWNVAVYSSTNVLDFSCRTFSRIEGGGIAIIIAERAASEGFSVCDNLQNLADFYQHNVLNTESLDDKVPNTVPCYDKNGKVTQLELLQFLQTAYSAKSDVPIHVFTTDRDAKGCDFTPTSTKYSSSYLYAATLTLNGSVPTVAQMNTALHEALVSAYGLDYDSNSSTSEYRITFVEAN